MWCKVSALPTKRQHRNSQHYWCHIFQYSSSDLFQRTQPLFTMAKVRTTPAFDFFYYFLFFVLFSSIDSNEVFSYVEIDEVREGNITYKRETPDCPIVFKNSGRFVGSRISIFEWKDEPETFLNMFLRKLRILRWYFKYKFYFFFFCVLFFSLKLFSFRVGYTKPESDKLCSQWKYRPSEKYIPLMPISNH